MNNLNSKALISVIMCPLTGVIACYFNLKLVKANEINNDALIAKYSKYYNIALFSSFFIGFSAIVYCLSIIIGK